MRTVPPSPPAAALPSAAFQPALPRSFPRVLALAFPAFDRKEGVGQRHRIDVLRQPSVDHESDRHAPYFSRRERLLREAEAFELLEIPGGELRAVARNRLPGDRPVGVVADLEGDLYQLPGMDAHALLDRRETPREVAAHVGVELHGEQPRCIHLAVGKRIRFHHAVQAHGLAQRPVERHHRKAETEHDAGDDEELYQHLLVSLGAGPRAGVCIAYHSQCRITMPTKNSSAIEARISAVLTL